MSPGPHSANAIPGTAVVDSTWTENHIPRLQQIVQEFFEGPVQVDLEIKDHLEVPANGKFQCTICEV